VGAHIAPYPLLFKRRGREGRGRGRDGTGRREGRIGEGEGKEGRRWGRGRGGKGRDECFAELFRSLEFSTKYC